MRHRKWILRVWVKLETFKVDTKLLVQLRILEIPVVAFLRQGHLPWENPKRVTGVVIVVCELWSQHS